MHLLAQESSRPADSRLHRAFARFQNLRDLVVTAPVNIAQNQRRSVFFRKRADGALDRVASLGIYEVRVLQRSHVRRVKFLWFTPIALLKEPGQRNKLAAFTLAEFADGQVGSNSIDVGRKCVASLISVSCPVNPHKSLLS